MVKDAFVNKEPQRGDPALDGYMLTAAMLSDSVDLTQVARAMRIYNTSSADVVISATMSHDELGDGSTRVHFTVPTFAVDWEPISVRRIWDASSTGLKAALTAGTIEVFMVTE